MPFVSEIVMNVINKPKHDWQRNIVQLGQIDYDTRE